MMATRYVIMFVDLELKEGRNTTVLGVFSTKDKACNAITDDVRSAFDASDAPIMDEDDEDSDDDHSFFLIQKFKTDKLSD